MHTPTPTRIPISVTTPIDHHHILGDAGLMQLMWLASPALPVGGFSYSEGLESAVDQAYITTEAEATRWLIDQLHLSLARSELPVIAHGVAAWRAADHARVAELNAWVMQTRESSELRAQTQQMGTSLVHWLRNHTSATPEQMDFLSSLEPSYPLSYALAASATQASVRSCLLSFAFGWAENMVQAAIKSVPLGQSAGQRILSALVAQIPQAIDHALELKQQGMAQCQAFTPMLAILSAQHETQYSRLFRS